MLVCFLSSFYLFFLFLASIFVLFQVIEDFLWPVLIPGSTTKMLLMAQFELSLAGRDRLKEII